ncbi:hypothetical protein FH608_032765 [Nonomuraea phyllanthi]|uniref:Uncharacterized protein n=1 Tax=Nonomuraea phyllanthi TaxID=2219224 RepID=A0A5C4VZL1_9ACTN|nr:hypothetical protein [Nonomuraea phyllanthi]KAB8190837.1 hypothetical protein FH608_032765 [Nonomuraea phyllanthi]QFY11833.1 hypothetical protein GBF35_39370 [Nonomuraea phyllanthi]
MGFNVLLKDLDHSATVQAAGIRRGYGGPPPRTVGVTCGMARLRCASLLKPLYAWVSADHIADAGRWRRHAEPAVVVSSNADTLNLWLGVGPRVILDDLRRRTGVAWSLPNGDPSRFGSVEVSASEVAAAYAVFAQAAVAGDPVAGAVLEWMRQVSASQAFGAREAVHSPGAGIKCGWYGAPDETCLRTHAVALLPRGGTRVTVAVGMTALPFTGGREREAYQERVGKGLSVEAEHEKVAGTLLRELLVTTLDELGHFRDGPVRPQEGSRPSDRS